MRHFSVGGTGGYWGVKAYEFQALRQIIPTRIRQIPPQYGRGLIAEVGINPAQGGPSYLVLLAVGSDEPGIASYVRMLRITEGNQIPEGNADLELLAKAVLIDLAGMYAQVMDSGR